MKSKEELTAIKEEVETVSKKLRELSDEELELVTGGFMVETNGESSWFRTIMDFIFKQRS